MLTNCTEGSGLHSVKCNKYWPDNVGDSRKFGDIQVQLFDRAEARPNIFRHEIFLCCFPGS